MADQTALTDAALTRCRLVVAMLVAGAWPGREAPEVDAQIAALPKPRQIGVLGGVLGMLFLLSLFAAQFGLLGMALFFLVVILLVA